MYTLNPITHDITREGSRSYEPSPELSRATRQWRRLLRQEIGLSHSAAHRRARRAERFTRNHRLKELAIPFWLTALRPEAVRIIMKGMQGMQVGGFGAELNVTVAPDHVALSYAGMLLGYASAQAAPWLRLLLPEGGAVRLARLAEDEGEVACQCYLQGAGAALRRFQTGEIREPRKPDMIRLWRDEQGTACSNIEHVVRHSPTGVEWGYGGSGPSDLAYSILCHVADKETAQRWHLRFKEDVIAHLPREGCELPVAGIRQWLRRQEEAAQRRAERRHKRSSPAR